MRVFPTPFSLGTYTHSLGMASEQLAPFQLFAAISNCSTANRYCRQADAATREISWNGARRLSLPIRYPSGYGSGAVMLNLLAKGG